MKLLIATDYDGTFNRGKISARDKAAVREWRAAGRYFGFVTGRGTDFIQTAAEQGLEADYFLLYNGALLASPTGEVWKEYLIPRDTFAAISEYFRKYLTNALSFDKADERPFYRQFYARFETPQLALAAADALNASFGDRVTAFVNGPHVNIGKKGSSKAQGVFDALEHFGLPADAAAVFGDDYNDMEMIRAHGGWAVFNARPEVLKCAAHVCAGVGSAARKLLREQKNEQNNDPEGDKYG